ncbi:hypothetical protein D3C87_1301440 [compost metagenome]
MACQQVLRFVDVGQDAYAAFVVGGALGGHADAARGPVQQLDRKMRLQLLDQSGKRGLGKIQRFRGACKAADIHHSRECLHRDETIHDDSSPKA